MFEHNKYALMAPSIMYQSPAAPCRYEDNQHKWDHMYAEVLGVLDLAVEQVPVVQVTLNQAALVVYFILF